MLGQFFEFIQNVVNLGILLQDFSFFCSDGSNPNDGGLFNTVLCDCDTPTPHIYVASSYTLLQKSSSRSIVDSLSGLAS